MLRKLTPIHLINLEVKTLADLLEDIEDYYNEHPYTEIGVIIDDDDRSIYISYTQGKHKTCCKDWMRAIANAADFLPDKDLVQYPGLKHIKNHRGELELNFLYKSNNNVTQTLQDIIMEQKLCKS